MSDPLPTFVFEDVSADLFQHGNLHVLVYADRLSGWPVVHQWRRDPTAREVVQAVVHNFVELGVPMRFRSDNGPQFDAGVFQETLKRWGVAWGNSTPHYPQSNGHAEAAVKAMKELVAKTAPSGDLSSEDFLAGLLEFRNTPPRERCIASTNFIRPPTPLSHPGASIILRSQMEGRHDSTGATGGGSCRNKTSVRCSYPPIVTTSDRHAGTNPRPGFQALDSCGHHRGGQPLPLLSNQIC
jgi:hypothetical protein